MLYRYVTREDEVDVAMVQGMNMGNMGRVIGFPWVTRFKMVSASCDGFSRLCFVHLCDA